MKQVSFNPNIERYEKVPKWYVWLPIVIAVVGAIGVCYAVEKGNPLANIRPKTFDDRQHTVAQRISSSDCREITKGYFLCNTQKEINYYVEKYGTIKTVTAYTCEGQKDCIDASGHRPIEGQTVACSRRYPLGSIILGQGSSYRCTDRTAKWIENKYPGTVDLFMDSEHRALFFGRKNMKLVILDK